MRSLLSRHAARVAAFLALAMLYGGVGFFSPGYDDEFTNVVMVEQYQHDLLGLLHVANTTDVHPPASYLINWVLYRFTQDWRCVRMFSGLFSAAALFWLFRTVTRNARRRDEIFGYLTICLSPTLLLWSTGLRWYSYFTPALALIFSALHRRSNAWRYFACLWFGIVLLLYIGYAAIVVAPGLALYALRDRYQSLRADLPAAIIIGLPAAALSVPQIFYLLEYHLGYAVHQTSDFIVSMGGFALNWFSGQGAYPISAAGVALIAGNILALSLLVRSPRVLGEPSALFLAASSVLFIVARLSGKFRNLVVLTPYQGVLQLRIFMAARAQWQWVALLLLIGVGNLWGIANVAAHADTTKGSWNMPYREALTLAARDSKSCGRRIAFTSDPVLEYELEKSGWQVATERAAADPPARALGERDCVTIFRSFRGALSKVKNQALFISLDELQAREITRHELGRDTFSAFKRRFDADVPDFYLIETTYRGVLDAELISRSWTY